jgi:branched-subunit amino acid aminotransferase/4-amino-4-deoxychorismate lyase
MNSFELDDYGFPKGSGIFETIKSVDGKLVSLNRHMRRAVDSARELGISIPGEEVIRNEITKTISVNPHTLGKLRICFGNNIFSVTHDEYQERTETARVNFYSETVLGSQHKRFPYDSRFAIIDAARDEGFDDSILFNSKNEITESAVANLIFCIGSEWVTPPISAGLLPGVVRAIAIEHCGVKVRPVHVSEIPDVESAFLLSSLRIAQPISHIGDMKVKIGEASLALQAQINAHSQPVSVG